MCDTQNIINFQKIVWKHFNKDTRVTMPWRQNYSPYYVLLSEFMLQQTQVSRVINYFNRFVNKWESIEKLSKASLDEVFVLWQGLGYYRRAKYLHMCAKEIVSKHNGHIPSDKKMLMALPGIGEYTSAAIMAFAYNKASVVVETNIRRAIVYHFYKNKENISETEIKNMVEVSIDVTEPRKWYWALMDYGASLSYKIVNPNRRTKIYVKQSRFEGSNRQVRAAILRSVIHKSSIKEGDIITQVINYLEKQGRECKSDVNKVIYKNIEQLIKENMLLCENSVYSLPK